MLETDTQRAFRMFSIRFGESGHRTSLTVDELLDNCLPLQLHGQKFNQPR